MRKPSAKEPPLRGVQVLQQVLQPALLVDPQLVGALGKVVGPGHRVGQTLEADEPARGVHAQRRGRAPTSPPPQ